ncbi:hypothetical protein J6590_041430 [Homalodisca vitripennis]|nr:hypothetical protein J6590_041430 [Homalodisca vitripennis]
MWTSTLTNTLLALTKPSQLTLSPQMMKCILRLVKRQATIFSKSILNRVRSQNTPASEIRNIASYILTCLHYILMCKDPNTKLVPSDGYKLKLLNELRAISVFAEEVLDLIKEAVSYVQVPGEPPSRVPSANDFFVLWTMENDDDNPIVDMLSTSREIPVNMSQFLYNKLRKSLTPAVSVVSQSNTNLGLQKLAYVIHVVYAKEPSGYFMFKVVHIEESIFWWGEFDIKSSLISVSLTSHYETLRKSKILSLPSPLDLYMKLDNSAKTVKVSDSTIQLDPNIDDLELDLKVKVHRIDRGPRSHTKILFNFPPTNSNLRVLIKDDFRPDYTMMVTQSKNISAQSPEYPFEAHNDKDEPSFLFIGIIPGPEEHETSDVNSYKNTPTFVQPPDKQYLLLPPSHDITLLSGVLTLEQATFNWLWEILWEFLKSSPESLVNHEILLTKMEAAGVRGVALSWFRCFLTGREQRVRVGECLSDFPKDLGPSFSNRLPQHIKETNNINFSLKSQLSLTDATECGSTGSNMNIRPGLKK